MDRTRHPEQFYTDDPYWSFVDNLNLRPPGTRGCLTVHRRHLRGPLTRVTNRTCDGYGYNFEDRQVYLACVTSGGSTAVAQPGGPGTETCNVNLPVAVYPNGDLGVCQGALSWALGTPSRHSKDLLRLNAYNRATALFVSWNGTLRQWQFNPSHDYLVAVCNHAPAY